MARLVNSPATPVATPDQQQEVIAAAAQRQYGRWAAQYRGANLAAAVQRDAQLRAGREHLARLQELATLRDRGILTEAEFARMQAALQDH